MLYAIPIGLIVGLLLGGRLAGLAELRFRWLPLFLIGLGIQLVLFSSPVTARVGDLGPPIYVASTVLVMAAVARNWRITGVPVVFLGAACNLTAIVANGGYMPAGGAALEALNRHLADEYSNSAVLAHPNLEPLTDIFAMPSWIPFANIFSLGDVILGVGVVLVIVAGMRRGRSGAGTHIAALGDPA
jgi:hypothetical protein